MNRLTLIIGFAAGMLTTAFASESKTETSFRDFDEKIDQLKKLFHGDKLNHRWSDDGKYLYAQVWDADEQTHRWTKFNLATGDADPISEKPNGKDSKPLKSNHHAGGARQKSESPDKRWLASVAEQQLILKPKEGAAITQDFQLPDDCKWENKFHWSPDSTAFVAWYTSTHPVNKVHYIRSSPDNQLQPESYSINYVKPGDKLNIPYPVVFFTDGREPLELDRELAANPYQISNLRWHKSAKTLTLEFIDRGFGEYSILEIDINKRTQRRLITEQSDTFVYVYGNCFYHELANGKEALWLSQRTGYNHLYLIDRETGETIRPLTSGNGLVRKIISIDEKSRTVIVSVSGIHEDQDPYFIHYLRVSLDDGKSVHLTHSDGTHELFIQPNGDHYLDKWSRVDHPPVHEIRRLSDGELIATIPAADMTELKNAGWVTPQPFVAKDRNGKFDIHGVIIRPMEFDPSKKYPVIELIYAGPQGAFVPKSWRLWHGTRSEIAESGFIVVQIDGLGTNYRGKEFHDVCYKNLIDSGLPDRIAWMKAAAKKHPELDLSRVGIFGGSAGGQSTLAALLTHPDFYKAGAADCGCHDNRMDKLWWNEQWMDWPVDDSYEKNANVSHIENLRGALMLTVGELDENVDPSSTYQVANALIKADKDFEYYVVPGAGHGIGDSSKYLRRKRIEFFKKHLQNQSTEK